MIAYFSVDIICSKKKIENWEWSWKKTVSYKEQIVSNDK